MLDRVFYLWHLEQELNPKYQPFSLGYSTEYPGIVPYFLLFNLHNWSVRWQNAYGISAIHLEVNRLYSFNVLFPRYFMHLLACNNNFLSLGYRSPAPEVTMLITLTQKVDQSLGAGQL